MTPKVAIIGAGIAGLTCGQGLKMAGFQVAIFDRNARAGGRLASRHIPNGPIFDYGAAWLQQPDNGLGTRWVYRPAEGEKAIPARIGVPDMATIPEILARDLPVRLNCEIGALTRIAGKWHLGARDGQVLGPYDWVVLALPAPQVRTLAPTIADRVRTVRMTPCWSMMVAFEERLPVEFDAITFEDGAIANAVHESAKPGRAQLPDAWVVHASAKWSIDKFEEPEARVAPELLRAFGEAIGVGVAMPRARYLAAHRWRHGRTKRPLDQPFVASAEQHLALIGDWCLGDSVEDAQRSGASLAAILAREGRN